MERIFDTSSTTRGFGVLEPLLARLRARKANQLIPSNLRNGRILDVGCGSYPYFLSHTMFKEKFAVDQVKPNRIPADIRWHQLNLNTEPALPFDDGYFSIVTFLAVIEHLNPVSLVSLFQESRRVIKPGGVVILTTPAAWSDMILKAMSRVKLVSKEEIDEHVFAYSLPLLGWYFGKAGFEMEKVKFGYFEVMLNMWATATK